MACFYALKNKLGLLSLVFVVAIGLVSGIVIYRYLFKTGNLKQGILSESSIIHSEELSDCRSTCTSDYCVYIANHIVSQMNENANPCVNFYAFACGGLEERLGRNSNYSSFYEKEKHLYSIIRDIIVNYEEPFPSLVKKLKTVYESCMDTGTSEVTSLESFHRFFSEIGIPNWPYLKSDFTFENPPLGEVLGRLYSYGQRIFITFYPSRTMADFDGESSLRNLTVNPQYWFFEEHPETNDIKNVVSEILSYTQLNSSEIAEIVEEYVEVEAAILQLHKANGEISNCSLYEGREECVYMDCTEEKDDNETLICSVLKAAVKNTRVEALYVSDGYCVPCHLLYYMESIPNLIYNYSHRMLANYIALKLYINNLEYLKFSFRRKFRSIFGKFSPRKREQRLFDVYQSRFCIGWLTRNLNYPLRLIYASHMLPKILMEEVNEMFKNVMNTLSHHFHEQDWIEEFTRKYLSLEAGNITNKFYETFGKMNETKMKEIFPIHEYNSSKESFIRNVMEFSRFLTTAANIFPDEAVYSDSYNPFVANAFFTGSLELGVGMLLPPFFKSGIDQKIFNYAKLGQILAHEAGHMFFYVMREMDEDIDNKTLQYMEERKMCLTDQFFGFQLQRIGKNVKGNKTLTENWADNVAMAITEKVVQKYLSELMEQKFSLPGLPYTAEELFYITYSQLWCALSSIEREQFQYEKDTHSPQNFRVIGMLQNSERFAQAFHCLPGTPMNPLKKCSTLHFDDKQEDKQL